MDRIQQVEAAVEALGLSEDALKHLTGTARLCAQLANSRKEDPELSYIAGLLHDVSFYLTGSAINHARRSAAWAEKVLTDLSCFEEQEIRQIHGAIYLHSDKNVVHSPFAQLLKEADVLQKQQ